MRLHAGIPDTRNPDRIRHRLQRLACNLREANGPVHRIPARLTVIQLVVVVVGRHSLEQHGIGLQRRLELRREVRRRHRGVDHRGNRRRSSAAIIQPDLVHPTLQRVGHRLAEGHNPRRTQVGAEVLEQQLSPVPAALPAVPIELEPHKVPTCYHWLPDIDPAPSGPGTDGHPSASSVGLPMQRKVAVTLHLHLVGRWIIPNESDSIGSQHPLILDHQRRTTLPTQRHRRRGVYRHRGWQIRRRRAGGGRHAPRPYLHRASAPRNVKRQLLIAPRHGHQRHRLAPVVRCEPELRPAGPARHAVAKLIHPRRREPDQIAPHHLTRRMQAHLRPQRPLLRRHDHPRCRRLLRARRKATQPVLTCPCQTSEVGSLPIHAVAQPVKLGHSLLIAPLRTPRIEAPAAYGKPLASLRNHLALQPVDRRNGPNRRPRHHLQQRLVRAQRGVVGHADKGCAACRLRPVVMAVDRCHRTARDDGEGPPHLQRKAILRLRNARHRRPPARSKPARSDLRHNPLHLRANLWRIHSDPRRRHHLALRERRHRHRLLARLQHQLRLPGATQQNCLARLDHDSIDAFARPATHHHPAAKQPFARRRLGHLESVGVPHPSSQQPNRRRAGLAPGFAPPTERAQSRHQHPSTEPLPHRRPHTQRVARPGMSSMLSIRSPLLSSSARRCCRPRCRFLRDRYPRFSRPARITIVWADERPVPSWIWWRQEVPEAATCIAASAPRTAGKSTSSPIAIETS